MTDAALADELEAAPIAVMGTNKVISYELYERILAALRSTDNAEQPEGVGDAMVERALHAVVPGGAQVWCWLPQKDAWTPHETAYDIMRTALDAALKAGGGAK